MNEAIFSDNRIPLGFLPNHMSRTTSTPKLAIIIPVFNTREMILTQLRHLQTLPDCALAEVIVVDDASTDGTAAAIADQFPTVTVLHGTGQLYWTGGIRRGMERALDRGAEVIVWLNHDCRPAAGTVGKLLDVLRDPVIGCVAAVRHLRGFPGVLMGSGFDDRWRRLRLQPDTGLVEAAGVSGNCVALRSDIVRQVGLPDARRFPQYGDWPYTLTVRRAGYRVLVHTGAVCEQDHDVARNLDPFWQVALVNAPAGGWLAHFLCSPKSWYQWRFLWHVFRLFRGPVVWFIYPVFMARLLAAIAAGSLARRCWPRNHLLERCLKRLPARIPPQQLLEELSRS
jgi:GT2 family glycosyltransferase